MKRILSALLISGALLCAMVPPAAAAESTGGTRTEPALTQEETVPDSISYYGQIQEIGRDASGTITRLYLTSESQGDYVMHISPDTVWIDSGNYATSDPSDLETGEWVYVYRSPATAQSIPPQSTALAVVRNIPQDAGAAQYHQVEAVARNEDGSLTITTDNGGLMISVDSDTAFSTYSGAAASMADVQAGDYVMAWYQVVMTSYPGQTYADHLMLLPAAEEVPGDDIPQDGTELTIVLEEDMVLPTAGRMENGVAMVPVAAVARALGYEAAYIRGQNGASEQVTVESDAFRVTLTMGENAITGVTKIQGAVGMTAPTDYGAAPYIVEPGTTWAPAQFFEMLGRTVTLEGTTLYIR